MKLVLWIVTIFTLAVLIGLALTYDTGYAIIMFPPYRITLSTNALLIGIVVSFIILYFMIKLIRGILGIPAGWRRYRRNKKIKAAHLALCKAGIAWFEGKPQQTEKEATKAFCDLCTPENNTLALLFAAKASENHQSTEKYDEYVAKLAKMPKEMQLPRHILQAEKMLGEHQPEASLAAIEEAKAISPNLTHTLELELQIRLEQNEPERTLKLVEKLLKADAITTEQAHQCRLKAYHQQLVMQTEGDKIRKWLKLLPEAERQDAHLLTSTISRLASLNRADIASQLITKALANEKTSSPELIDQIGELAAVLPTDQRLKLMRDAEKWLETHQQNAKLLLALGRLSMAQQLWGKAQGYLEAALSIDPELLPAHVELIHLYEQTEQPEMAEKSRQESSRLALQQNK